MAYINYKQADWQLYKDFVADLISNSRFNFSSKRGIEKALNDFIGIVKHAQECSIPQYRRNKFRRRDSPTDQLVINGEFGASDEEKANEFAATSMEFFQTALGNTHINDERVVDFVDTSKARYADVKTNHRIQYEDVNQIIKSFLPMKAPGLDGIRNIELKYLPKQGIQFLTTMFNACLKLEYYPNAFKQAIVIPLLKKGKSEDSLNNYRLIHMFSAVGKIFDKIVANLLRKFAIEKNIISEQSSPLYLVKQITDFVKTNKQQQKSIGLVHLDAERAFDSVWHYRLMCELIQSEFPPSLWRLVDSFLERRRFQVTVKDSISYEVPMFAGLPQGSSLSTILYSIYTRKIPTFEDVQLVKYTDDFAIFVASDCPDEIIYKLNSSMVTLKEYFQRYKFVMNIEKTEAIVFPCRQQQRAPACPLMYEGSEIPLQDSIKYLGIIMDKMLTYNEQVIALLDKADELFIECERNMMYQYNDNERHMHYVQKVRPKITMACPLWFREGVKQAFDQQQEKFLHYIQDGRRYNRIEKLSNYLQRKFNEFATKYPEPAEQVAHCYTIRLIMT